MDQLRQLPRIIPDVGNADADEAESQATQIIALIQQATSVKRTSIIFTLEQGKKIHPLVFNVLTMKGYTIQETGLVTNIDAGTTSYSINLQ